MASKKDSWIMYYKDNCSACDVAKDVFMKYKIFPTLISVNDPSCKEVREKFNYRTSPIIIHNNAVLRGGGNGLQQYLNNKGYKPSKN